MNTIATATAVPPHAPLSSVRLRGWPDPLAEDQPTDEIVVTTRRGMVRMALVAAEAAARFQREGVAHDVMAWMLAPRDLFAGRAAIDACVTRDACLRGAVLHGLSLGLDADPTVVDRLIAVADDDGIDGSQADREAIGALPAGRSAAGSPRHDNVLPLNPKVGPPPQLFTATVVHDDGFETVHAFHASFAVDEAEIARRLHARIGAAAADAAIVAGFDHTSPIVEALVSQAICDTLMMINTEPLSPLAAGLDLNIEQRFLA